MMSKTLSIVCVTMLATCQWQGICADANAQGIDRIDRPFDRPTFSPYLNMFRSGDGPVLNYFGTVRPQQQFYAQDQQLGRQLESVQGRQVQQFGNDRRPSRIPGVYTMGVTGHTTGFNTVRSARANGQNATGQQFAGGNSFREDSYSGSQQGGDAFGNNPAGGNQYGGGSSGYGNPYGGYSGHSSGFSFGSGF